MFRNGKPIQDKVDSRLPGRGYRGNGSHCQRVQDCFLGWWQCSQIDDSDGCTTQWNILKITKLDTWNEWIVGYVNYISIKQLIKIMELAFITPILWSITNEWFRGNTDFTVQAVLIFWSLSRSLFSSTRDKPSKMVSGENGFSSVKKDKERRQSCQCVWWDSPSHLKPFWSGFHLPMSTTATRHCWRRWWFRQSRHLTWHI